MPVKEADPAAQSLDAAFAEAMAGPAKPRDVPAPPEVDPEAPHGRADDGTPKAPFGLTKEGRPRKSPAGRPAKDGQARIIKPEDARPEGQQATLEPRDFSAPLMDAAETLWFGGSIAAKVGPQIPLLGKFIPGQKLAATMAIFDSQRPRLAMALNLAAQHDTRARKLAARLADGDAGWALTCMFMVAPFAGAVAAVWQTSDKHDALTERGLPKLDVLAKANEEALDRMFAKITAQMETAQALAAAQQQEALLAQMGAQNGQVAAGVS